LLAVILGAATVLEDWGCKQFLIIENSDFTIDRNRKHRKLRRMARQLREKPQSTLLSKNAVRNSTLKIRDVCNNTESNIETEAETEAESMCEV
jgi:hypothetical protein